MIVLASVIIAAVFVAVSVTHRATEAQRQLQQDIVLRGADAVGLSFNTALKREWSSLHAVARNIGRLSTGDINDFMDAVVQAGMQTAWSGVANLDGKIISGSYRLREGEDVSESRWYRQGLRGPSVGGVQSSNLLMHAGKSQSESILNLSTPVFDDSTGEVTGVLVYSLRLDWVRSVLSQARDYLHIDVVVQTRDGVTIVDTRENASPLPATIVTRARLGQSAAGSFQLLDEADELIAFTSSFISGTLPDFGWNVFAVLDRGKVTNVLPDLVKSSIVSVSIAALFVLGTTLLFLRILLLPLEKLTATAVRAANGDYEFPVESRSSKEAFLLSRALVRIQGKLALREGEGVDTNSPYLKLLSSDTETPPQDGEVDQEEVLMADPDDCLPTRRGGKS